MIVRPRPGFFSLFFIMRGSIVPRILPHIIGFAAYAAAVVFVVRQFGIDLSGVSVTPFGLLGVALSIYLGFRNNAAYDRWWEARKLWGQLVYETRNLSRAATALIGPAEDTRALLVDQLAFCHFLRGHLRGIDVAVDAEKHIGTEAGEIAKKLNPPDEMVRRMGTRIGRLRTDSVIDPIDYRILDERLSAIAAVQAGCERIVGTPLPFAYTLLLHRTAYAFCLLLPFGLAGTTGWWTPLFTAVIAYTFFGLDELSAELEDPFGLEANDLALDSLCRVCEISVAEALGDTPPAMLPAEKFYLS